jgi:hypothetical protein
MAFKTKENLPLNGPGKNELSKLNEKDSLQIQKLWDASIGKKVK